MSKTVAGGRERWIQAAFLILGCVLLAAFTASQIRLFVLSTGGEAPWPRLFFGQLLWWLLWAALLPLVLFVSRRLPLELLPRAQRERSESRSERPWGWGPTFITRPRIKRLLLHLGIASLVAFAQILARVLMLPLILGRADLRWTNEIVFAFSTYFHWNFVLYWLIVASEHAWRYRLGYRQRELEASHLQAQLVRAELEALRQNLQPHFLFNALQSVAELLHESPEKAEEVVLRLGELLRWTLKHEDSMEVPLAQELVFTERYLQIEKIRFEERLRIVWNVAPEATEARVPQLLLQPLVENAIRHGLQSRLEGGTVTIEVRRVKGSLELSVSDDGLGLRDGDPRSGSEHGGLGLENTRARLERFYGSEQRLSLQPGPGGGARTLVVIPFHRESA